MDESVIRAMDRWPDVPAVYGWLELDVRGRWRLRGEPVRGGLEARGRQQHEGEAQRRGDQADAAPDRVEPGLARADHHLVMHAGWL